MVTVFVEAIDQEKGGDRRDISGKIEMVIAGCATGFSFGTRMAARRVGHASERRKP
jgi:hypothetical protein